jgi:formylglycine-generating enzyme required for sulfatase activity
MAASLPPSSQAPRLAPRWPALATTTLSLALGALLALHALSQDVPTPAQKPFTNSLGMRFVELPPAGIMISAFEVRIADWRIFAASQPDLAKAPPPFFEQDESHPAVNITLAEANAFCHWLTERERAAGHIAPTQAYRLPTRLEWDAAVGLLADVEQSASVSQRFEEQRSYPWGTQWPPPAGAGNLKSSDIPGFDDPFPHTAPVGSFQPNRYGIYDLAGNVWEWVDDQDERDAQGVLRGGSWVYFREDYLRSGFRYEVPKDLRAITVGFRPVLADEALTQRRIAAARNLRASRVDQTTAGLLGDTDAQEDPSAIAAMRERLGLSPTDTDPSAQVPPTPGGTLAPPTSQGFTNSLGMRLVPRIAGTLSGQDEVRVADYEAFVAATGRAWPGRPNFEQARNHPAVGMSLIDARAFCAWLTTRERELGLLNSGQSYRLPTDAEWSAMVGLREPGTSPQERAAAGAIIFPWGDAWPPPTVVANIDSSQISNYDDRFPYTSPVGSFAAFRTLNDVTGNAAEWCDEGWEPGSAEFVARGGSWLSSTPEQVSLTARTRLPADATRSDTGFRLLLVLEAQ